MSSSSANERTPLRDNPELDEYVDPMVDKEMFRLIIACSYSWFMWNLMYTTVVPMLPFYALHYGLSTLHMGMILASLQIGFLLGVIFMNASRLGPKTLIHMGGICYIVGPALIAYNPGLWTLCIGRLIEGFGAAPLVISHDSTLARRLKPNQKGRAFGIKGAIGTSGLFFGPIVGGFLFQIGGLRLPMIIITCLGLLGIFIYFFMLPDETFVDRCEVLADGSTVAQRFRHFFNNQLLTVLMCIQMMTFMLIGILFLAVPDFLYSYWLLGIITLTCMWLAWDVMKVAGSILGGWCADMGNAWITTFAGLILQSFCMMLTSEAANAAMERKADWKFWWFIVAVGITLSLGTTVDGFIGGPFVKLMTEVERKLGKVCYEELFSISCSVVACGEALGNLYCGYVYQTLGFGMTLYSFAWFQLVGLLICGYCVQGLVRPLFDKEGEGKKELDADKDFSNFM
jgi:MFS family permease